MQIAIFEMVKRGLSIDAALAKARMLETSFDQQDSVTRDLGGVSIRDEVSWNHTFFFVVRIRHSRMYR